MTVWRLIPLWEGRGQIQMAVDRWLFDRCYRGLHPPVLRFYGWTPAAISLGQHQRAWPPHWQALRWQDRPIDLVRRPTGGRAVLHAGDLTYCIVLPHQSGHRRQTYEYLCEFLIRGWRSLGVELQFGTAGRGYQHQVNCFESATAADLVTSDGFKLIGSAQGWQRQTVLQHGSMQLQLDPDLQRQVFGEGAEAGVAAIAHRGTLPSADAIVDTLARAAAAHFEAVFEVSPLTASEWKSIQGYLDPPG
ncbi:biotin/lipoate A/B protein ligase family protein [Altericista sp. CCNU0014]|uniref:lipoate--protein ligase family protein n=1 Tax=Altericista sp. CCNU0014 TaxID=3082949 RepID=UPI00384B533C